MITRFLTLFHPGKMSRSGLAAGCLLALGLFTAAPASAQTADTAGAADARLREALRTTMLQLRSSENERITLQTANDALLKEKGDLQTQVKAIARQAAEEQESSRKVVGGLEKRTHVLEAENKTLGETIEKWKKSHADAADLARTTETERARLAVRLAEAERLVADREAKNVALFKVGSEILNRLERFGLGDAIKAREPFVGVKRVELQNLVQGYGDKLIDERVTPGNDVTSTK